MDIVDTLSFLVGRWTLERLIIDHRSGTDGRFDGDAVIVEVLPGLHRPFIRRARYDESGTLHFGRHVGAATRRLDLERMETSAVMLSFADGKPFVDLDLRDGPWRSVHACGEDEHEIVTVAQSLDVVEEHWRVRGPTQDYDAFTILRRSDH